MKKDIAVPALCMTTLFERILLGEIPSHEVAKGKVTPSSTFSPSRATRS